MGVYIGEGVGGGLTWGVVAVGEGGFIVASLEGSFQSMLSGRSWCHSGGGSLLVLGPRGGLTQRVVAAREWGFTIISRGGSFQFVP